MSFAFGHILGGWSFGKIAERVRKIQFSHYTWFFIIFGALLPDVDFLIDWVFKTDLHRTFSHSIFFLIAAPITTFILFHILNHPEKKQFALALAIGILSHLTLDFFTNRGIPLLWPSLLHFSVYKIHYFDLATPSFLENDTAHLRTSLKLAVLDMTIGTAFLFYLWWRKKIKF